MGLSMDLLTRYRLQLALADPRRWLCLWVPQVGRQRQNMKRDKQVVSTVSFTDFYGSPLVPFLRISPFIPPLFPPFMPFYTAPTSSYTRRIKQCANFPLVLLSSLVITPVAFALSLSSRPVDVRLRVVAALTFIHSACYSRPVNFDSYTDRHG